MVSPARRQIIGGGGAPINKSRRRRPQIVGGGGAARPAHGSICKLLFLFLLKEDFNNEWTAFHTLSPRPFKAVR